MVSCSAVQLHTHFKQTKTLQPQLTLLNTVKWLFNFKQLDWFSGRRLSADSLVIDYIWKMPETEVISEWAAS